MTIKIPLKYKWKNICGDYNLEKSDESLSYTGKTPCSAFFPV